MTARRLVLQFAPRWMNGVTAAAYVGVSPNTFAEEARAGIWPPKHPKLGRWDRAELDRASDRLSNSSPGPAQEPDLMGRIAQWGRSR